MQNGGGEGGMNIKFDNCKKHEQSETVTAMDESETNFHRI